MRKVETNSEIQFSKKKDELIKINHRAARFFSLASLFFVLIWICAILTGPFYDNNQNPRKYDMADVFFVMAILFAVLGLAFIIIGIINVIICKNKFSSRINFFKENEKESFLKKYLIHESTSFGIYLVSIVLIILGIKIKENPGMIMAASGLLLLGFAFSNNIYIMIVRLMYREKSKVLGDIIKQKGLFASLTLLERGFILCLMIAFVIFLTIFVTRSSSIVLMIFALGIDLILFGYLIFSCIKVLKKNKKGKKAKI